MPRWLWVCVEFIISVKCEIAFFWEWFCPIFIQWRVQFCTCIRVCTHTLYIVYTSQCNGCSNGSVCDFLPQVISSSKCYVLAHKPAAKVSMSGQLNFPEVIFFFISGHYISVYNTVCVHYTHSFMHVHKHTLPAHVYVLCQYVQAHVRTYTCMCRTWAVDYLKATINCGY